IYMLQLYLSVRCSAWYADFVRCGALSLAFGAVWCAMNDNWCACAMNDSLVRLAKFLVPILDPLTKNQYTLTGTLDFINCLNPSSFGTCFRTSFDIESLRMEDLVSCKICAQVYDCFHFIPKILKCGHTFCSPCLIKLLQENPRCPNCRIEVNEIESSLPKMVDIATEVAKRKDIILKKKTQMTLNVKILDKCLAKLEELTMSQSERIDTVNTRKILDEIDEDLKKTDDVEDSEQFLLEIYKRLQNGEKVFAVHKINEEFKYGEVLVFGSQLFFYSLNSSQVPKDSSLIWFEDVKQCLNYKSFCTFIKICCNEKNVTLFCDNRNV
ncbi:hypothetical protein Avbf_06678, partial [Armadillidium vulgare]